MGRSEELYRLQQIDSERDAKLRRLSEIKATLDDDRALQKAQKSVKESEKKARKWQTRQRDLELEIDSLSDKMSRSEKRLYGGKVHNPKELSDLQAEIESLQRRRRSLEDTLLEAMINREEAEGAFDAASGHLEEVESRRLTEHADLEAERKAVQQRLEELANRRTRPASRVDAAVLATYERIRELKRGQAVAQIKGGACSACGVAVAPSMEWRLREGEMIQCDTCRRILVLRDS